MWSSLKTSALLFHIMLFRHETYYDLQKRRVHLTPEQASDFYAEHYGKLFFPSLVAYMSSGPIIVLMIAKDHAISFWRELIGPTNAVKARQTHPEW